METLIMEDICSPLSIFAMETAEIENTQRWITQEKERMDTGSWNAWLSTLGLTGERVSKACNEQNSENREPMIIHASISRGRKWNGRAFWNTDRLNECSLTCPCMMPLARGDREPAEVCRSTRRYEMLRDRKIWTSLILQGKTEGTHRKTYGKKYCMCGRSFNNEAERDHHISIACDDKLPHDVFFDELPRQGGCYILIDTTELTVIAVECIRFPITHSEIAHSTEAESLTWIEMQGECVLHNAENGERIIRRDSEVLMVTDSMSTVALAEEAQNQTHVNPRISQDQKKNMGSTTQTMRSIKIKAANEFNVRSTTKHHPHEHGMAYNDDRFCEILTKLNRTADKGATTGAQWNPPPPESLRGMEESRHNDIEHWEQVPALALICYSL